MEEKQKQKRVVKKQEPKVLTKEEIEQQIRLLEKQKRLLELDIEKLKVELEFLE